ncbi:MAG: N-acetyltransferase family protein, partial [Rhodobacteraceae bacterium]|nr:N-acetyltransferase family protein [Paracoccaceae bacterium]
MNDLTSRLVCRAAQEADGADITRIDTACLETGHATFRADVYDWGSFQRSYGAGVARVGVLNRRLVAWSGISRVSQRQVYAGVGETSVYVDPEKHGHGIGAQMMRDLIEQAELQGFWTLTAQIFPENQASIAIHERCGFKVMGRRERLGKATYGPLKGQWRDVMFLE